MKLLVIDDSPVARMIVKKTLPVDVDFEIAEAGEYKAALDIFKDFDPELTFLDLTMPEISGLEVLEELLAVNPEAKIVVISADRQKQVIAQCMEKGAMAFLPKPPERNAVKEIIEKVIGLGDA